MPKEDWEEMYEDYAERCIKRELLEGREITPGNKIGTRIKEKTDRAVFAFYSEEGGAYAEYKGFQSEWCEKRKKGGSPPTSILTAEQRRGREIQQAIGWIYKRLWSKYDIGSTKRGKSNNSAVSDDIPWVAKRGKHGRAWEKLMRERGWTPDDATMAAERGCTKSAFSEHRSKMRKEGWDFKQSSRGWERTQWPSSIAAQSDETSDIWQKMYTKQCEQVNILQQLLDVWGADTQ